MCEEVASDSWYDLKKGTSPTGTHDANSEKPAQNVLAHVSRSKFDTRACPIHWCFYDKVHISVIHVSEMSKHTSSSLGVIRASGSLNKQLSTKSSASLGNRPSGVSRGAGSFTICCNSSRMLIIMPPPCKLTPLDFRRSFFVFLSLSFLTGGKVMVLGERVPSKSERSESSGSDSEKGNRPRASSINEIPSDQTSDLTVYWAPCIRSGYTVS